MAMTAWSANVSSSAICWSVNGRPRSLQTSTPIGAVAQAAARPGRAIPTPLGALAEGTRAGPRGHVGDVESVRRSIQPRGPHRDRIPAVAASHRRVIGHRGSRGDRRGAARGVAILDAEAGQRAVGAAEASGRFSTIASSTRSRSVGEEAMTRSTSAVAVCCSSASVSSALRCSSSSNSRAFSMAMTAWSANVSSSAICWSLNGRTSRRDRSRRSAPPAKQRDAASAIRQPRVAVVGMLIGTRDRCRPRRRRRS